MGKPDERWYRIVGTNSWIASAVIDGNAPGSTPLRPTSTPTTSSAWQTAIDNEYNSVNDKPRGFNGDNAHLGNSVTGYSDATPSRFGTYGKYRGYENGSIHWTEQYGAVAIWGGFQQLYGQYGGSGGSLGFPKQFEYDWNGGRRLDFEGGYFFWHPIYGTSVTPNQYSPTPTPNPTPPSAPTSITINGYTVDANFYPVFQNYQGTLGNPISGVQYNPNTGASYQLFSSGSIVSSGYGTFPIYGAIRDAYLKAGGLNGFLGAPATPEVGQGNGVIIQRFYGGYIIWNGVKATAYKNGSGPVTNLPPISSR